MTITCKVANMANCPQDTDICCGVCGHRETCDNCCEWADREDCPDAEIITDELVAFQSAVPTAIQKITDLFKLKKQLDEQEKDLKANLLKAMEHFGIKSFKNDFVELTYVAPTTRSTIDSARLKKDHPDLVALYTKTSPVSASVRVSLKGGGK